MDFTFAFNDQIFCIISAKKYSLNYHVFQNRVFNIKINLMKFLKPFLDMKQLFKI
jgi:hypothetical protein